MIDLSNLHEIGSYKKIKREVDIPELTYRKQEIETPYPFLLNLSIYNTMDSFVLTGSLKGVLMLSCSRCLDKFKKQMIIKIDREIIKEDIEDISKFDLTEVLIKDLVLAIPIKMICSDNCKGLCTICGQNLNEEKCDCDQKMIDPRLAKLKDFYKDDE